MCKLKKVSRKMISILLSSTEIYVMKVRLSKLTENKKRGFHILVNEIPLVQYSDRSE